MPRLLKGLTAVMHAFAFADIPFECDVVCFFWGQMKDKQAVVFGLGVEDGVVSFFNIFVLSMMVGLSVADVIVEMGGGGVALIDTKVGIVVLTTRMLVEIKLRQIHRSRSGIYARTGVQEMPVAAMSCNAHCIGEMAKTDVVDGLLTVVGGIEFDVVAQGGWVVLDSTVLIVLDRADLFS